MKSNKSIAVMLISGAIGGLFISIFHPKCALLSLVNILSLVPFFTVDTTINLIEGVAVTLGTFVLSAVLTILFVDFDDEDKEPQSEGAK